MNEAHKLIIEAFCNAVEKVKSDDTFSLTDMYVGFKPEEMTLSLYDDNETLLQQIVLDDCVALKEATEEPESEWVVFLRQALDAPEVDAAFASLDVVIPVSVILVNDERETICELKTFDSEMVFLENDLLKKMGEELDDFFEQLMADVK